MTTETRERPAGNPAATWGAETSVTGSRHTASAVPRDLTFVSSNLKELAMNIASTFTARFALAAALALGATGAAMAADIDSAAVSRVSLGESQDAVRAAFGEPTKHNHYLFAPGSSDLYYISGGTLGNEWVLQINYDANDRVISSQRVNAGFFELNRMD